MANEMNKKYELTDETMVLDDGTVLHRIRAVRDFTLSNGEEIYAGNLGGWIEKEANLSQTGKAWVDDDARVYGAAVVYGSARVFGFAWVYGSARVYDSARVFGFAWVYGSARVYDSARVFGDARVYGAAVVYDSARVYGNARVGGYAEVFDSALVYGAAWVYGYAEVGGSARVYDDAVVHGDAEVCGEVRVYGDAEVGGSARVNGSAQITGDARVKSSHDYAAFKNTWSSGRWFTYTRSDRMWTVGCFRGTGDELIARAYKDSELSGQCYEAIVRAQEAIENATDYGKRNNNAA